MLYKDGDLTEKQAEAIIGKKMMSRIKLINSWLEKHGYKLLIHSTDMEYIDSIFKHGLTHNITDSQHSTEEVSSDEILQLTDVTKEELRTLDKWAKEHKGSLGRLGRDCKTRVGVHRHITQGWPKLRAKELLEYSHGTYPVTVVLVVPRNPEYFIKNEPLNPMLDSGLRGMIPYLRAHVACEQEEDGSLQHIIRYLYPTQGILFAFDRDRKKVRYNDEFDETYFLSPTSPQRAAIRKGDLLKSLRELDARSIDDGSQGGER